MQIHLRLGVKDADIIYWKNYLPKSCFCMYVKEILAAEKMKKIAVVPVPVKPGFSAFPVRLAHAAGGLQYKISNRVG